MAAQATDRRHTCDGCRRHGARCRPTTAWLCDHCYLLAGGRAAALDTPVDPELGERLEVLGPVVEAAVDEAEAADADLHPLDLLLVEAGVRWETLRWIPPAQRLGLARQVAAAVPPPSSRPAESDVIWMDAVEAGLRAEAWQDRRRATYRRVAEALAERVQHGARPVTWRAHAELAALAGCSTRTVARAAAWLVATGLLHPLVPPCQRSRMALPTRPTDAERAAHEARQAAAREAERQAVERAREVLGALTPPAPPAGARQPFVPPPAADPRQDRRVRRARGRARLERAGVRPRRTTRARTTSTTTARRAAEESVDGLVNLVGTYELRVPLTTEEAARRAAAEVTISGQRPQGVRRPHPANAHLYDGTVLVVAGRAWTLMPDELAFVEALPGACLSPSGRTPHGAPIRTLTWADPENVYPPSWVLNALVSMIGRGVENPAHHQSQQNSPAPPSTLVGGPSGRSDEETPSVGSGIVSIGSEGAGVGELMVGGYPVERIAGYEPEPSDRPRGTQRASRTSQARQIARRLLGRDPATGDPIGPGFLDRCPVPVGWLEARIRAGVRDHGWDRAQVAWIITGGLPHLPIRIRNPKGFVAAALARGYEAPHEAALALLEADNAHAAAHRQARVVEHDEARRAAAARRRRAAIDDCGRCDEHGLVEHDGRLRRCDHPRPTTAEVRARLRAHHGDALDQARATLSRHTAPTPVPTQPEDALSAHDRALRRARTARDGSGRWARGRRNRR